MTRIRHTDVKDFSSPSPGDLSQATGLLLNR